jgi:hypothetical protein
MTVVTILLALAGVGMVGYALFSPSEPIAAATPVQVPYVSTTPDPVPSTTEPPLPEPRRKPEVIKRVIDSSPAEKLYFPRKKQTRTVAAKPCPITKDVDGSDMLDPDRVDFMVTCGFVRKDYSYVYPGTDTKDLAVIAGHTWQSGNAAFNMLYNWQKGTFLISSGEEMWVQTKASGNDWLVYKAEQFFTPLKHAGSKGETLAESSDIWGTKAQPNVIVTVGCLQQKVAGVRSIKNIAIKWRFDRVEER